MLDAEADGLEFSVIVIHNRSLSGVDDAARGEWVRTKRLEQAQSVARLVESLRASKVVVVGDYNAFEFSDGYVDVVGQIKGSVMPGENLQSGPDLVTRDLCNLVDGLAASERYSFVFQGNAQALDHALVNPALGPHVVKMQYARGNADAWAGDEDEAANVLRASDHDGLVVYLTPDAVNPPPCEAAPPPPVAPAMADLRLTAESEIISENLIRYSISAHNDGPDGAGNVVVKSTLRADVPFTASSSGCAEDPDGVPQCSLGYLAAGESASITIDIGPRDSGEARLTYSGSVASGTMDPVRENNEIQTRQPLGRPRTPSDLTATGISSSEIELRWKDRSGVETEYEVFLQGPGDLEFRSIGTVPANASSTVVDDLVPDVEYGFALEARNGPLRSERTPTATAWTWFSDDVRCNDQDVLCLGRFAVEVAWEVDGGSGRGQAERLTAETGDFWFFDPENIELVVKVLDGCAINGHYWVFAAGLTDVGVTTTVRDLGSDLEKSWTSPRGTAFEPIVDTSAFATCSSQSAAGNGNVLSGAASGRAGEMYREGLAQAGSSESACAASDSTLCLQDSRYEVRASWTAGEQGGTAFGFPRTADTGMFWFFSPANVEVIVKVLDGCGYNGHRWVLMGGLTDVGVEIAVTDTESGDAKRYRNPEGASFATKLDLHAFSCSK